MKKPVSTLALFFGLLILISACSSTRFTAVWQPDDLSGPLDTRKVFVQVHTNRLDAKQMAENELVRMLESLDLQARGSLQVFGLQHKPDSSKIEERTRQLLDDGIEAALVVSVLDVEKSQRYNPGMSYPTSFYGYGWGYYHGAYGRVYEPGYYSSSTTVFLLTDIYDLQSRKLVWSGQTKTLDPSNLKGFVREFAKALRGELKKDQVFASR